MSEPPPSATKTEDSADISTNLNGDGDTTEPTADILNALNQLNSDTVPTAPNSQESIKAEEQQPKEEEVPQQPQLSEWESLRNRLRDSPHDPEGWTKLVELAENSGEIEEIKETYESLLETYPNTVCQSPASRILNDLLTHCLILSHPPRSRILTIL
jgi:cleavage stimulation factor subunit 3